MNQVGRGTDEIDECFGDSNMNLGNCTKNSPGEGSDSSNSSSTKNKKVLVKRGNTT